MLIRTKSTALDEAIGLAVIVVNELSAVLRVKWMAKRQKLSTSTSMRHLHGQTLISCESSEGETAAINDLFVHCARYF